ncbi:CTP synthase-like, partial [Trifolium medium]|nr:CTP synthase-like [Trifolium medium]
ALLHASVARNRKLVVDWVPAGDLEDATFKEVIIDLSTVAAYVS